MYEYQYVVGGSLSLLVSLYILVKRPRTLALKFLFLFGIVVSLWETSAFLSALAPDLATATTFYAILFVASHFSFPIYLLTVLNVREERNVRFALFVLIPAIIEITLFQEYLKGIEIYPTGLRFPSWTYRVVGRTLLFYVYGICFVIYLVGTFVVLLDLRRKTRQPLLRRKYTILVLSYTLFQTVGLISTNIMLAFGLLSPSFRVGGILQFLTFLSIWYALTLKEERVLIPLGGEGFSKVYSSFLTVFYNSVINSSLGEEVFKFRDFIDESKIENQVSMARNQITFKETEDLDLVELITRNLEIFDKGFFDDEVVDSYLRVLNAADKKLGWKFDALVKANEDCLKRFDLIYGISEGKFLERIAKDESLRDLDDVDACLKIYKRILLQIVTKIQVKTEFRKKLSEYYITEAVKMTDYDEISMKEVRDRVLSIPRDRRLSFTIERFNPILSWAYESILTDPSTNIEEILRKLRLVLTLNKEKAVALGVYPTLLGTLATKVPQTEVRMLYSDYLEELVEERTEELEKTQKELLSSQRMAAIGEVAAMVGHDLRNPLQSLVNIVYLMKKKVNSAPTQGLEILELAETVEEQVRYMNKIVSDLQDYARPIKLELVETSLRQLVSDILSEMKVPKNVEASMMIEENFRKLIVDPVLIKRVFINLFTNALQAMPDGGQLKVRATKTEDTASISIEDTGLGISEENLNKIFHPLFTTKARGQGLGLAVCKRLVQAHGGSITVESKEGKGSTFTVKIPLQGIQKESTISTHAVRVRAQPL